MSESRSVNGEGTVLVDGSPRGRATYTMLIVKTGGWWSADGYIQFDDRDLEQELFAKDHGELEHDDGTKFTFIVTALRFGRCEFKLTGPYPL